MEEVIENDNRGEIIDRYSSSDNEVIQLSFHFFFQIFTIRTRRLLSISEICLKLSMKNTNLL